MGNDGPTKKLLARYHVQSNVTKDYAYINGVPEVLVPDNLKAGVKSPHRYEPDINPTYQEFARHYGVAVVPARTRRPKDKAKVEVGVQVVERWILARLRDHTFFSLADVNQAIGELLQELNQRPMRHLEKSRQALFAELDQPALAPLPRQPYEFARLGPRSEWTSTTMWSLRNTTIACPTP